MEQGNKRLALALAADPAATDAARILRPPGTFNHKPERMIDGKPAPVCLRALRDERYPWDEVVGALPDPNEPRRQPTAPGPRRSKHDDALLAIPPPLYVELLTGHRVGRDGKTVCPFHPDRTPSLHVYPDPKGGLVLLRLPAGRRDHRVRGAALRDRASGRRVPPAAAGDRGAPAGAAGMTELAPEQKAALEPIADGGDAWPDKQQIDDALRTVAEAVAEAERTGDPAPAFDAAPALAQLPEAEYGKAKSALKKVLGRRLNLRDLDRAVKAQRRMQQSRVGLSGLPEIVVTDRALRDVCDDALAALEGRNSPPTLFAREGRLARLRSLEAGKPVVELIASSHLLNALTRAADFVAETNSGRAPCRSAQPRGIWTSGELAFV